MFSLTKLQMALIASILAPLVASDGIIIADTASPAACTGSSCCIPSCRVSVTGVQGCASGYVDWSANCEENYADPSGTQDIDGCKGYEMSWTHSQADSSAPVIVIRDKDNGQTDTFAVSNCKTPSGGCSPKNGGCDSNLVFVKRAL